MILVNKTDSTTKGFYRVVAAFPNLWQTTVLFLLRPNPDLLLSPLLRLWNQERTPASPLCPRQSKPRPSSREILSWSREPKLWEDECECSVTPAATATTNATTTTLHFCLVAHVSTAALVPCCSRDKRLTVITRPQLMLLSLFCSGLFWTSWFRRRRTTSKTWASWWRWDTYCLF